MFLCEYLGRIKVINLKFIITVVVVAQKTLLLLDQF